MKKAICLILIIISLFMITGCEKEENNMNNNNDNKEVQKDKILPLDEFMAQASKSSLKCDSYSLGKYMKPFWESQVIYNETAMFFKDKDGTIKDKALMYPIAQILEVRDNTLNILYEEGKDYTVVDGKLHYVEGSSIFLMEYDKYYLNSPNNLNAVFESLSQENKYLVYNEGDYFTSKQVSITYVRTDEWEGPEVKRNENKLPKTMKKLKNQEPINIVFYGDSIMEGCNSSAFNNVEPQMPTLSKLVTKKLINYYEYSDIKEINTAVGGWTTNEGVVGNEFNKRVLEKNPDLVVIHFGTNDATFNMNPNTFGNNMKNMMKKVLQQNPDCEFILVSAPKANPDAKGSLGSMRGNIYDIFEVLEELCEDDNVAFADASSVIDYIYTKKEFIDITGNNINHPNDFLIRVIAQTICAQLID